MDVFHKAMLGCALLCTVNLMRLLRRIEKLHPDYKKVEVGLFWSVVFYLWLVSFDFYGAGLLGRALFESMMDGR